MKKLIYGIWFIIFFTGTVNAQYTFLYRQYVLNQMGLNPAYTGSREVFSTAMLYRNQWTGIDGAPVTQTISADTPLKNNKVALGMYLINEKIGLTRNTNIEFNYAYRIPLNVGKISLGLKGALNTFTDKMPENLNSSGDVAFNEDNNSYFLPNFGVGVYYYNYNKFFIGASVPFLLSYQSASANNGYEVVHDFDAYNILFSSGVLFTYNENFKFRLSGMAEYNKISSFDFDLNAMFIIKESLWAGASYYTTNMLTFIMQYQLNPQLKIGYSYDHNIGDIDVLNGSHEVLLRYEFSYKIDAFNPRYF